ncbi:MAG: hypothetical protein J0L85_08210 [Zoogloea sp.]|uniref:cytochrome c n=1 Tax=Zoogloea sp. TaxID=49181 RepID=UPI001AC1433F|nr:hypothetical protein [Zoogloea sp.]
MKALHLALLTTALLLPTAGKADNDRSARLQYILHCAGCHQSDGHGAAHSGVPDMRGQLGHFVKVPEGRAFLVKVPGSSNSALNNAELTRLLNWMLQSFAPANLPPDFVPYTESEVTALRSAPLDDVAGARAAVVTRLAERGISIQ